MWPFKFLLLILATNPDGSYKDHTMYPTEFRSIVECETKKPTDEITSDGTVLSFRCVMQVGA